MNKEQKHEPQIYVACLAAYNSGHLHGEWITPKADKDELQEQINKVLKSSPIKGAEEWAVHDYDDFPNLGEYPDLDKLIQVQEAIDEHGKYVVHAFLENWSIEDLDHIQDAYYGEYDSFSEFAQQLAEDTIEGLNDNSTLSRYFDWNAWERDLEYDFHEGEGENGTSIIFNNNW
tara:strand:- start:5 stop:526 length:522 start_codon:yes stop_codon:yes gene_type:complete